MLRPFVTFGLALTVSMSAAAGHLSVKLDVKRDDICRVPPGTMTVWRDGQILWKATTQGIGGVTRTIISPDDRYILAIADGCGYVQLWDIENKKHLVTQLATKYSILNAEFTPDSKRYILNFAGNVDEFAEKNKSTFLNRFASGSLWDIIGNKPVGLIENIKRESYFSDRGDVAFSADGKKMIFTDSYGPASVFDAFTGAWIQTFSRYEGRGAASASFSTDGKQVSVTYVSGATVTYDVQSGKFLKVLKPSEPGR